MQRNGQKRFRKFLSARHQHAKKAVLSSSSGVSLLDFLGALLPPLLFLGLYLLFSLAETFSIIYPVLHGLALAALIVWGVAAYRGTRGFWRHRSHLLFAGLCAGVVAFGSCWPIWDAGEMVKAWASPPAYVRAASQDFSASSQSSYALVEGSVIHISLQDGSRPVQVLFDGAKVPFEKAGEEGALVSFEVPKGARVTKGKLLVHQGWKRIALWSIEVLPDKSPQIGLVEEPTITTRKTVRLAYKASDDFGVESVKVRIAPTASAPGVSMEPVEVPLASPNEKEVEGAGYADLTHLPWVGVPVTIQLIAIDGAGNKAWSNTSVLTLPSRAFRNPFARALIEEREKLLAKPDDASARDEAANVMAGIARQQGVFRGDPLVMVALRAGAVRLVLSEGRDTTAIVADMLWQSAIRLEEGAIGLARASLVQAFSNTDAMVRFQDKEKALFYTRRFREALEKYNKTVEKEREKQPFVLQEVDWPATSSNENVAAEEIKNKLLLAEEQITETRFDGALKTLSQLQAMMENLRTTPPELTAEQTRLVEILSSFKILMRGQKQASDELTLLMTKPKTEQKNGSARLLVQQRLLLAAMQEMLSKQEVSFDEAKASEKAIQEAVEAMQDKKFALAKESQDKALSFMQNTLSLMQEQMRRSMTAKAP